MAERFYAPDLNRNTREYELADNEARHLRTVMRARVGAVVELFDGNGLCASAELKRAGRKQCLLNILNVNDTGPNDARLTMACALPKGDRAQFLVEKLTELGIGRFAPLETQRSVVRIGEGKLSRLRRTVVEACKQCGRNDLMEIADGTTWAQYVQNQADSRWILHPRADEKCAVPSDMPSIVAVGPEGGWTDDEVAIAKSNHWQLVSLPGYTLRLETAALSIAAWFRLRPGVISAS